MASIRTADTSERGMLSAHHRTPVRPAQYEGESLPMKHIKTVSVQQANLRDELGNILQDFIDVIRAAFNLAFGRVKDIF